MMTYSILSGSSAIGYKIVLVLRRVATACVFRKAVHFSITYIGWLIKRSSKIYRNVENACINGVDKFAFKLCKKNVLEKGAKGKKT